MRTTENEWVVVKVANRSSAGALRTMQIRELINANCQALLAEGRVPGYCAVALGPGYEEALEKRRELKRQLKKMKPCE